MTNQYKCVVLFAREHGLESLRKLIKSKNYKIIAIFTHRLNPKSYDSQRKERSDFNDFVTISKLSKIPFFIIDSISEKILLERFSEEHDFDFLISISWRYLIPPQVFKKAKIGSVNLHRGDLPKYAGAEPIKRALENKENTVSICAHHIIQNFDEGEIICKIVHPTNYDGDKLLNENVDRIKHEITPYFSQLTLKSLKLLLKSHEK